MGQTPDEIVVSPPLNQKTIQGWGTRQLKVMKVKSIRLLNRFRPYGMAPS